MDVVELSKAYLVTDPDNWDKPGFVASWLASVHKDLCRNAPYGRELLHARYVALDRRAKGLPLDEQQRQLVGKLLRDGHAYLLQEGRKRGGARPKLGEALTSQQKIQMACAADSRTLRRFTDWLSAQLTENELLPPESVVRSSEEFRSLTAAEAEVVQQLLCAGTCRRCSANHLHHLSRSQLKRQPSMLAAFIAQFLCDRPVDLSEKREADRCAARKEPRGWFAPAYAIKLVRKGRNMHQTSSSTSFPNAETADVAIPAK